MTKPNLGSIISSLPTDPELHCSLNIFTKFVVNDEESPDLSSDHGEPRRVKAGFHLVQTKHPRMVNGETVRCKQKTSKYAGSHFNIFQFDKTDMRYFMEKTGNVSRMTQQARRAPALPVFKLPESPPWPRSSGPSVKWKMITENSIR